MPALVGGFGNIKIKNYENKFKYNLKKYTMSHKNVEKVNSNLGPYLAGLIEGDGTFAIHDKQSTAKKYRPMIIIVFKKADLPLAEYLQKLTQCGTVYLKQNRGYVLWQIQDIVGVYTIISIINGYMRTPKIEALHRAIDWLNKYENTKLIKQDLDKSDINSNSWLAGFTDGDGNFSINLVDRKKRGLVTTKRVQAFFRIELRQNYHRETLSTLEGTSYFFILNKIATYLNVNLYSRTREKDSKIFHSFMVISHNTNSHKNVIEYFDKFPLYSGKYMAYRDWRIVVNKIILRDGNPLQQEEIKEIERIKSQFNSKRTMFDFRHLETLNE